MPKNITNKITVSEYKEKRKNGDIYVWERTLQYDPLKKQTRVIKKELKGKIINGHDDIIPTRKKRSSSQDNDDGPEKLVKDDTSQEKEFIFVSSKETELCKLLEWIDKESGISRDLMFAFNNDLDTVNKINCLARYIVATNGAPLPEIYEWLKSHNSPYPEMTEKTYYNLFRTLGCEKEENILNFQACRARNISDLESCYLIDTSSVSTYGENNIQADYGFNKDGDDLKVIKIQLYLGGFTRQPFGYCTQHGNIPDVISLVNACNRIRKIVPKLKLAITDNGFYSEANICYLLLKKIHFLILIEKDISFVRDTIFEHKNEFRLFKNHHKNDKYISSVKCKIKRTFKGDDESGNKICITSDVYLYIYKNSKKACEEAQNLFEKLNKIKESIANNIEIKDKKDVLLKKRFLREEAFSIEYNEYSIENYLKESGVFVLISDEDNDPEYIYKLYKIRTYIEDGFQIFKTYLGGRKPRNWYLETYNGRLFVQFVALCYYSYIYEGIRCVKYILKKAIAESEGKGEAYKIISSLNSWINNKSIHQILLHFDSIKTIAIKLKSGDVEEGIKMELTKKDKMFLEKFKNIKTYIITEKL